MAEYIELFVTPVPKKNLKRYCKMSQKWGNLMKKHGVLEYREFSSKDAKKLVALGKAVKLKKEEVLVAGMIRYKSKAHRDQVNKKSHSDPLAKPMAEDYMKNPPFDFKRMLAGGFVTVVKA